MWISWIVPRTRSFYLEGLVTYLYFAKSEIYRLFLQLFSYYEDELESMLSEEESKEVDDDFRINLTIAILWFCTALLSLPTLIVWIKSPKYLL